MIATSIFNEKNIGQNERGYIRNVVKAFMDGSLSAIEVLHSVEPVLFINSLKEFILETQ